MRITLTDGTRQVVEDPAWANDSIAEVSEQCRNSVAAGRIICERTAVAVASATDISFVEVQYPDVAMSLVLLVAVPIALLGLAWEILQHTCDPRALFCDR